MRIISRFKTIFLVAVFLAATLSEVAAQQEIPVTGRVTAADDDNETLVGANVVVKGTTTGTVTDVAGNYSLTVPRGTTLVFSSIGYQPKEVVVGNQTRIDVTMNPDVKSLEEIVIVGYGQQKKKDITGSISSVFQPINSITSILLSA